MKVPFLNFHGAGDELHDEIHEAIDRVLRSGWFILGNELEAFEAEFAQFSGTKYAVGVANGLDAIRLLLEAYGIGPGDEVIVPSHTFIATWLAVSQVGATPVPVDVDIQTYNLIPGQIARAVTSKTKAIIPVHLYGRPADMDAISEMADSHGLIIIEDNAQSVGAEYIGRRTGSLGNAGATSFYPGKNLGALGDGGAITTDNADIAEKVRILRNYGSPKKYMTEVKGINSRLDEIQAAILRVKLKYLDEWNQRRKEIANKYNQEFKASEIISIPSADEGFDSVWHLYVIRTKEREALQAHLQALDIATLIHYPVPPHLSGAYNTMQVPGYSVKNAEELSRTVLSLPIGPHQTVEQTDRVIEAIRSF